MGSHVINISLPNDNYDIYYTDFCGKRHLPYLIKKEIVLSVSEDEAERFGKLVKKTKDGEYLLFIKIIDRTKIKCRLKNGILYKDGTPGLNYLLDNRLNITKADLCVDLFTADFGRDDIPEYLLTRAYLISMDAEVELKLDELDEKYKDYCEEVTSDESMD
jgi:hypothetical protein